MNRLNSCGRPVDGVELKISRDGEVLVRGATVFQAEMKAIEEAVKTLQGLNIKGKISIHSDSRSAVEKLTSVWHRTGQTLRVAHTLQEFAEKTHLRLHWIKAHAGNRGNERADELAKNGTNLTEQEPIKTSPTQIKSQYRETALKEWQKEWTETPTIYS